MSDYIERESRTFIEIADDLNDLVSELNDKIVELIREKNIDVAPVRHGRWIESTTDLICSACETAFNDEIAWMCRDLPYGYPMYCPYCGAKMDGDEND